MPAIRPIAALRAIQFAEANAHLADMQTSAVLCAQDARACFARGDYQHAHARALRSLSYSVGVLHPTYRAAADAA